VNGVRHTSVPGRRFLHGLGFDLLSFSEEPRLRLALKLFDAFLGPDSPVYLARMKAGYLASDLFGPPIHNLPLEEWLDAARGAGLHFRGSRWALHIIREAAQSDLTRVLLPRSRAEVCELVEHVRPAAFHQLVFTPNVPMNPPWKDHANLLQWRPIWTGLYRPDLPSAHGPLEQIRDVSLHSPATNTRLNWQMPGWELEILRRSRTARQTLGEILSQIPVRVSAKLLREQLYTLHQLVVLNFAPVGA
jgi:hypothetical protein